MKGRNQTGGGPPPSTNPENADDICSWLPSEFAIDNNDYDSDSINQVHVVAFIYLSLISKYNINIKKNFANLPDQCWKATEKKKYGGG